MSCTSIVEECFKKFREFRLDSNAPQGSQVNDNGQNINEDTSFDKENKEMSRRSTLTTKGLNPNHVLSKYNFKILSVSKGNSFGLGSLVLTLKYNIVINILQVHIKEAKNLLEIQTHRDCNPYLTIAIYPSDQNILRTKRFTKTKDPKFNELKLFKSITETDLKKVTMNIKVFDSYSQDNNRIIGEINYSLKSLAEIQVGDNKGEISLEQNVTPIIDSDNFRGHLLVSLYLDLKKGELIISILRGKDLQVTDRKSLINPYCILKLSTVKSNLGNKKTMIKYKTLNPTWNESFTFRITQKNLDDNISLQIKVLDNDPVNTNKIGELILSSKDSSNEWNQWKDMINTQKKSIAEWQTLKSCS